MGKTKVFEHQSVIETTADELMAFHVHPKAFKRLTPPPIFIQVHRNELTSLRNGEVEFTLWFGVIPVRWIARHEAGPIETSFMDRQIKGPLERWEHQHLFQPIEGEPAKTELIDRITIEHKTGWRGWLTRLFLDGLPLRFLFMYRHQRTKWALRNKSGDS